MSERFERMASEAFSFLEGVGFQLVCTEPGQLRYESPNSECVVNWDARSGELEAFVGLRPATDPSRELYSLTDLLGMVGIPDRGKPRQVADESRLRPFVEQLARDLQLHAQPALAGDRLFFRRLETYRHASAESLTHGMKLSQVRSAVEQAWQSREFGKVTELYESIESDLSDAERARLDYARRHRGN